ncbi:MAG TPA: hypothetical protein VGM40_13780 [Mycobacterium sp.]
MNAAGGGDARFDELFERRYPSATAAQVKTFWGRCEQQLPDGTLTSGLG